MSLAASAYAVMKLDSTNYMTWAEMIFTHLCTHDLQKFIDNTEPQPNGTVASEVKTFNVRKAQAYCFIQSNIPAEFHNLLPKTRCPATAWANIKKRFCQTTSIAMFSLHRQLYNMKCGEDDHLPTFINNMHRIISRIREAGQTIHEDQLVFMLLHALPPSYTHVVTTILHRQGTRTWESVTQDLQLESDRRSAERASEALAETTSLLAHARINDGRTAENPSGKLPETTCYFCGYPGHRQFDCRSFKKAREQKLSKCKFKPNNKNFHFLIHIQLKISEVQPE